MNIQNLFWRENNLIRSPYLLYPCHVHVQLLIYNRKGLSFVCKSITCMFIVLLHNCYCMWFFYGFVFMYLKVRATRRVRHVGRSFPLVSFSPAYTLNSHGWTILKARSLKLPFVLLHRWQRRRHWAFISCCLLGTGRKLGRKYTGWDSNHEIQ